MKPASQPLAGARTAAAKASSRSSSLERKRDKKGEAAPASFGAELSRAMAQVALVREATPAAIARAPAGSVSGLTQTARAPAMRRPERPVRTVVGGLLRAAGPSSAKLSPKVQSLPGPVPGKAHVSPSKEQARKQAARADAKPDASAPAPAAAQEAQRRPEQPTATVDLQPQSQLAPAPAGPASAWSEPSALPLSEPVPHAAPILAQAIDDPSLTAAVLPKAAHLTCSIDGAGDLSLHVRVLEGVAHVRADGAAAHLLNRLTQLEAALAPCGLRLGQLDLAQQEDDRRQRQMPDEDDRAPLPGPRRGAQASPGIAGGVHVKA
jgi:hypothetical protein